MILIRFLIISICILYIIRSLVRLLLPVLFQNMMNRAQQGQRQQQRPGPPPGKINLDYVPPTRESSIPDSEGEFIDYEEIK